MNRLRLVLDTNFFLVSLAVHSKYHWLYQALVNKKFDLVASNEILTEYQKQIALRLENILSNSNYACVNFPLGSISSVTITIVLFSNLRIPLQHSKRELRPFSFPVTVPSLRFVHGNRASSVFVGQNGFASSMALILIKALSFLFRVSDSASAGVHNSCLKTKKAVFCTENGFLYVTPERLELSTH